MLVFNTNIYIPIKCTRENRIFGWWHLNKLSRYVCLWWHHCIAINISVLLNCTYSWGGLFLTNLFVDFIRSSNRRPPLLTFSQLVVCVIWNRCSGRTGMELTSDMDGKKTSSFAGCSLAIAGSGTGPPMSCFSSILEYNFQHNFKRYIFQIAFNYCR